MFLETWCKTNATLIGNSKVRFWSLKDCAIIFYDYLGFKLLWTTSGNEIMKKTDWFCEN